MSGTSTRIMIDFMSKLSDELARSVSGAGLSRSRLLQQVLLLFCSQDRGSGALPAGVL